MMHDTIRIVFLVLSGSALLLLSAWYVSFCIQEITGTGQVVIDPVTVVSDDGKGSDDLGGVLAQMLQVDLESRASELQNAQQELDLNSSSNSQASEGVSPETRAVQVVGNIRGWTPDVPLKIFLLKPLNTSLLQPVDMKLSPLPLPTSSRDRRNGHRLNSPLVAEEDQQQANAVTILQKMLTPQELESYALSAL